MPFGSLFADLKNCIENDEEHSFEDRALGMIAADVRMISGCKDEQTSADVYDVSSFGLPDTSGKAGGACTSALLKVLYADKTPYEDDMSFVDLLNNMRDVLSGDFNQIPQLSSSRNFELASQFSCVKPDSDGAKRALLIGINYVGQQGELRGCHNDVNNIKEYLMDVWGYEEENIVLLLDDGEHDEPTRDNIFAAWAQIVEDSVDGDSVFCHYSGHGGRVRDDDGDEDDGYDETLIPVDYQSAGQIRDDEILSNLVARLAEGVYLTYLMDCCHSGTILDLPYHYQATEDADGSFHENERFKFGKFWNILCGLFD